MHKDEDKNKTERVCILSAMRSPRSTRTSGFEMLSYFVFGFSFVRLFTSVPYPVFFLVGFEQVI